ncbi:MAG: hypothetical protein JXB48_09520, partial [Candidatus Latescibacteria bacterium]|nr:hypothetical protein [Candidatus Latescibacterota bacterium]
MQKLSCYGKIRGSAPAKTLKIGFFGILLLFWYRPYSAELLMHTHGYVSFAPYINGIKKTEGLYPAYRAEFMAHIDFVRWNNLILTGLVGNKTMISRTVSSVFELDKIRYTVAPGLRYEFNRWLIRGSFHHESVYSISRAEEQQGATWQNSIRIGAGTKGAYYLFLRERYEKIKNAYLNAWDIQINTGVFLRGPESIWVARNHDYRFEEFSTVRYHLGSFHQWAYFTGLSQQLWIKSGNETEQKIGITVNAFRKGTVNFFGFYYTY